MNYYENPQKPPEPNYYQTGSTRPKKSHSGIIAALIAIVIVLGGIVSALGLLNIHLFQKLTASSQDSGPVGFSQSQNQTTDPTEEIPSATVSGNASIALNQTPEGIENIPQTGGLSLQSIYEKAIDSVVSVSCSTGTGTGVVFSADGYIVTNAHVVENGYDIQVLLTDGRHFSAQLVGMDPTADLAVLRVDAVDLTAAEFGSSDTLRVGDTVVAIGDPLGVALRGTMTDGIVSAINRDITTQGRTMSLIQTNAALNAGNSGGPLLNCYGQVIGINTIKIGDNMSIAGVEGLGFAIPSTTVKEVVDQLVSQGYVSGRPSLGITGQDLSSFDRLYYRLPQGVYIVEVTGELADQGIAPGDILLQIDDTRVLSVEDIKAVLYNHSAGDTVTLTLYRGGSQYSVEVTLNEAK
jgi:serine protease Do